MPEDGCIWLETERMVLIHQTAIASLRRELIDTLGAAVARSILMRFGHTSGATDAALARRAKPGAEAAETFLAGPRLHAIEGIAASDPVAYTLDPTTGFHVGEFIWRNSVEAEAHLATFGVAAEPVCWMAIGYASAYTSAFMGRPILYREVECRATGAPRCRLVGKPAELWPEAVRDDLHQGIDLTDPLFATDEDWTDLVSDKEAGWSGDRLVGASPGFVSVRTMIDRVARSAAPVLFAGEAGVGKKTCARALHRLSNRAAKPFVAVNCAALAGDQLDAELFGYERGAMPGGASRTGKIERAHGGSLLLEDVDCLDMRAQAKILRLLQTGEIDRLGGSQGRGVNVRIIATCADMTDAVRQRRFREDLYYRLTMFPILIPPLRERRSDLPLLIRHFLTQFAYRHGKRVSGLSSAGVAYLLTHQFPGNVAELQSMIERAVILVEDGGFLDVTALAAAIDAGPRFLGLSSRGMLEPLGGDHGRDEDTALDRLLSDGFSLEHFERTLIERAVTQASGNLSRAAKALGLTRPQLAYRYRRTHAEGAATGGKGDDIIK